MLLDPKKIKEDTNKRNAESAARTHRTAEEEAASILRLNKAKDQERKAKETRDAKAVAQITPLETRIIELKGEVATLEERKKVALEPIVARETAAQVREEAVEVTEKGLVTRETALKQGEELVTTRLDAIHDREDAVQAREDKVATREDNLSKAEDENKRVASALSDKWLEFHQTVHNQNKFHLKREAATEAHRKANAVKEEENRLAGFKLSDRERALKDGWETLQNSTEEVNAKPKND